MINKYSVMMDLEGTELQADETQMLNHDAVGGLILFSRNFVSSEQLVSLLNDVNQNVDKPLLIAVDNEGGRVQRFKTDHFTKLPAMGALERKGFSRSEISDIGWLMASECFAHGIDLSFAPVLDIEGGSDVVGDRAFSADVEQTITLASYWCEGMKQAGMATVGKHFPGHGSTKEDSHVKAPVDNRSLQQLLTNDTQVFSSLINESAIDALMPAHIVFTEVDDKPAGYSEVWIKKILKQDLGFNGVLFSDDLSMVGAGESLSYFEKASLALNAGCDMVLVCNNKAGVQELLAQCDGKVSDVESKALTLRRDNKISLSELTNSERRQQIQQLIKQKLK